ncbi:MAG: TIGR03619 family F420-dependent LLM class oxidoreductase [SAR202 cluster bacterium]|nr:TIGR03619 family F420-dependent LLM class oxidoreductase [SAR202 cluster bacterium]
MKFGIVVTTPMSPAVTPAAQVEYIVRIATSGEEAGFDSVWVADRTVYPHDIVKRYPHMFGPHHSKPDSQKLLEAITVLSYLAGVTKKMKLGTTVLCLPFRHPVLNAKMVTSLDVLSGGRVILGVGTGWMREEFEGMYARMDERGSVTDEHIEMFKALCTQDVPEYRGKHFQISGKVFFPRPVQKPHPPVWVGGKTDAALRRAAKYGDGWDGIWLTPDEVAERRGVLEKLCREQGRSFSDMRSALTANVHWGEAKKGDDGKRLALSGTTKDILDDVRRYEQAGLDHLIVSIAADSTDDTVARLRRFATDIAAKV